MMKTILWLCNRPLEETQDRRDGTWFTAMARALVESGKIRLAIVAQAKVKDITQCDFGGITQWVVPYESLGRDGLPSGRTVDAIKQVADEIKPDLIHVWGTENYWGLLTARSLLTAPTVLEIQGLKYACADVYYGGLSLIELIRYIGPLEILLPRSSWMLGKLRFKRWGTFEKEMILMHKYISTQSDWVRMHIRMLQPHCIVFKTGIMLRKEFYNAQPWLIQKSYDLDAPSVFASSSGSVAYKGLHVLVKAIAILKNKYPKIVLNIAGDIIKNGIRRNCYARWLQAESRRLGVADNIHFLGPLDADELIQQFYKSSVVVIPSFIETYSLALAEAMFLGVPAVASYAGAMPELARDGESALFFPIGDASACALQIDKILSDQKLAERLSQNARKIGLLRNDHQLVIERQIEIYNDIISKENRH
jgi:glycosyltransferase involved in cell wall biosynthesis